MFKILEFIYNYFFIFLFINKSIAQNLPGNNCFTSDYQIGECVNILGCPDALALVQMQFKTPEILQTLRNSQCGQDGQYPKVCCALKNQLWTPKSLPVIPTTESYNPPWMSDVNSKLSDSELLPSDCGADLSSRIFGGERASIDEFPWMTLIEYEHPDGRIGAFCSGVVISARYILTAAHCIDPQDTHSWRPVRVILGEYDRKTNPDCVPDGYDSETCAPPIVKVNIEEQIQHEDYRPASLAKDRRNDIALIRLSSRIKFTDYIKPICLPNNDNIPQKLWVAGWGATENGSRSDIKLKLSLSLSDQGRCQRQYGKSSISLSNSQICAGGQLGKDSCKGDSGGPLMFIERAADGIGRWTAAGIVSFGPDNCGLPNWPGVYTKVADYKSWIIRRLQPEPHYWK